MTIIEALRLPEKGTVPSIQVLVTQSFGTKETAIGCITTYKVQDHTGESIIRFIQPGKTHLFVGCNYRIRAHPTTVGLRGIEISSYRGQKRIDCDQTVLCDIISNEIKDTTTEPRKIMSELPPPPYTQEQHINIQLRNYFQTKDKALTKGISEQHAHEVALSLIFAYPQGLFGEKDQN